MINTNNLIFISTLAGFGQYTPTVSFSASISAQSLGAGNFIGPIRAEVALNNENAISQVQIQYSGLDSFTRILPGNILVNYPNAGSASYQVQSYSYFSGGILFVDSYIINETGGSVSIPAITFNCTADLFAAPF